jgi:hypothetical protein
MNPISVRTACLVAVGTTIIAASASACGASSNASNSPGGTANVAPAEFGLSQAQLDTRIEETEKLIASCMTAAGFNYIALDAVTVKKAMNSDQSAPGVSNEEYVKQFGLGITTQLDKPLVTFGAGPENNATIAGLPKNDQVAYKRALWGEALDWNHARALEQEDLSETGGCTRTAAEAKYSATELSSSYVNPGDKVIAQDPRTIAAIEKWGGCMRADGYDYDNPDQVDDDLRQRLDAIAQGQDPQTLTGPALDALHALQGEELAIAAKLTTCEEDIIEPVQAKIEAELYGGPQS